MDNKCRCGSGLETDILYDGRGIYLTRCCDDCREEVMSHYNPVILEYYTQADVDEPIEEEEW